MNQKGIKRLWYAIGTLVLLSPLGILVPELCKSGSAWGEWDLKAIAKQVGFEPQGMKRLSELWGAPLPDYAPIAGHGLTGDLLGYVLSGAVGVIIIAAVTYGIARILAAKDGKK